MRRCQRATNRRDWLTFGNTLFPVRQQEPGFAEQLFLVHLAINTPAAQLQTNVIQQWLWPRVLLTGGVFENELPPLPEFGHDIRRTHAEQTLALTAPGDKLPRRRPER